MLNCKAIIAISITTLAAGCQSTQSSGSVRTSPLAARVAPCNWHTIAPADQKRADIDLNGDGKQELVVASRSHCQRNNCTWKIAAQTSACPQILGEFTGATLVRSQKGGPYRDVYTLWLMKDPFRALRNYYRYDGKKYQLKRTVMCRKHPKDGWQCATSEESRIN